MPTPIWWLLALPFVAGACLPLQAGINGQLAKQVSSVLSAALISFGVGTLALLILVLAQRELPGLGALKGLTWWHWRSFRLGGLSRGAHQPRQGWRAAAGPRRYLADPSRLSPWHRYPRPLLGRVIMPRLNHARSGRTGSARSPGRGCPGRRRSCPRPAARCRAARQNRRAANGS